MALVQMRSLDQYSDEELMNLLFELSGSEGNEAELSAIDAVLQARLAAHYGAPEPGTSPRIRFAA